MSDCSDEESPMKKMKLDDKDNAKSGDVGFEPIDVHVQLNTRISKRIFIGIHLGAGEHPSKKSLEYKRLCELACNRAIKLLKNGGSAGDAVVEAVKILEDSKLVNAGSGSNLTLDGKVECDAGYMAGDGYFGAVGAAPGLPNPILAAKALADIHKNEKLLSGGRNPPTFLAGSSVKNWAASNGVPTCDDSEMICERAKKLYERYLKKIEPVHDVVSDTVGAVALDYNGHVASAVSSGGPWLKYSGRIGHAPMFGCGCWSSNGNLETDSAIAVSTSGSGEILSRVKLAQECAAESIKSLGSHEITSCVRKIVLGNETLNIHIEPRYVGVIALIWDGKHGEFSWMHTTKNFVVAYLKGTCTQPLDHGKEDSVTCSKKYLPTFHFSQIGRCAQPGHDTSTGGTSI